MNALSKEKDSVVSELPQRATKHMRRKEEGVLRLWQAYGLVDDRRARRLVALALARLAALRN